MFKPPLPFMGNKRNMLKKIEGALAHLRQEGYITSETIFIDTFGGSGLVAHNIKQWYPNNEVIWNDFDNYQERLHNIHSTERLRQKLLNAVQGIEYKTRIKNVREILEVIENHDGYIDYITVSSWLLFSGNYVNSFERLRKRKFYNRLPKAKLDNNGYLAGVKRTRQDFKELLDAYREVEDKLLILDPPLFTDANWGIC
ncbi:DNA adenine methylase [Helicobacter sp.]|uniref:DNA adenine methylase n=1 Tax=Helicobacter sp. TaxID=218 RepID=UPI002A7643FC|nr:DNA adenine methylase [Helicobacter sp.]MDY2585007.1 DNA adenine methylase [Helicobacter sp.]